MITIFKNIIIFITDPKNTRMILLGIAVVFLFLFLHQCNAKKAARAEVDKKVQEIKRVKNNFKAAKDTIEQYKIEEGTWEAEKKGYLLEYEELESDYRELFANFKKEKNKPPRVVVRTEYIIRDSIRNIPVILEIDSLGNKRIAFSDSIRHDSSNYMSFDGGIPYDIVFNEVDSIYELIPQDASINFEMGMNLDLGIFQDKETKEVFIKAQTNYPGLTFTRLDGALIKEDDENRKTLRTFRKTWGVGLSIGYALNVNTNSGNINAGPYFGIGLNYTPKFLQWGK